MEDSGLVHCAGDADANPSLRTFGSTTSGNAYPTLWQSSTASAGHFAVFGRMRFISSVRSSFTPVSTRAEDAGVLDLLIVLSGQGDETAVASPHRGSNVRTLRHLSRAQATFKLGLKRGDYRDSDGNPVQPRRDSPGREKQRRRAVILEGTVPTVPAAAGSFYLYGLTNCLAGRLPLFAFTGIVRAPDIGSATFAFNSRPGCTYKVEYSNNPATWTPFASSLASVPASGILSTASKLPHPEAPVPVSPNVLTHAAKAWLAAEICLP